MSPVRSSSYACGKANAQKITEESRFRELFIYRIEEKFMRKRMEEWPVG